MNLRLREDRTEALKQRAEQEAIVRKAAKEQAARWGELMGRLK
ncbi:hypothetical protein ACFRH6_29995 [Streptomyces sp. NPDC056749]